MEAPARPSRRFENLLEAIGHTPLVAVPRMSPSPAVRIYAKLEFLNPTGSVKDRAARALVEHRRAVRWHAGVLRVQRHRQSRAGGPGHRERGEERGLPDAVRAEHFSFADQVVCGDEDGTVGVCADVVAGSCRVWKQETGE